ncbi:GntR family transcriptional regulator [Methyloradius palustris]|uniref:GntR family transcriptional regulator n=2 Tax=Methyloradius palustris TaxID=2778876 RepID=A0A8D5G8A3_9PROT|nr:GntR family transcriptional regulator [Methyloradius palustris]
MQVQASQAANQKTDSQTNSAQPDMAQAHIGLPSYQPLYEQIKKMLTQSLINGEWAAGAVIPSEMELASRYQVSQGTVRKAIDALVADNIMMRRQGKGTYVVSHAEEGVKVRFLRLADEDGAKIFPRHQLLSCERAIASKRVAVRLGIEVGSPIIEIKRLLVHASQPLILDHIAVSAATFTGLDSAQINAYGGSMNSMYEQAYGIRMVRAEEALKAVAADETSSQALGVALDSPLLQVERTAYTYGDKPIEWRLGLCLTDAYHYRSELD